MENSVLTAIERFSLLEGAQSVTVALSGGADSMSLLYALFALKDRLNITLSAAHLNHMIRGAEADRDEQFVREQCGKLGIPLFCERADVPKYAEEKKLSTELAARELRYAFLERINTGVIATAHTASDNLETMLFNLTRGAALKGLCGIPPKRGVFIRPLILCTRTEVETYCEKNGIEYVTDSTNLSDNYTRNNIRHNVIPVLKQINPSVEKSAVRTAASLFEDESFLSRCAARYVSENSLNGKLDITVLPDLSVAKRAVKLFAEENYPALTLDNKHITEIYGICKAGGRVSLPENLSAVSDKKQLRIIKNDVNLTPDTEYFVETECVINNLFTNGEKINNLFLKNSLDCDKIIGKSVIRTRQAGDSIRLSGRSCTKSLKKLMSELKIPLSERDVLPVIADDRGVIWIYGIGVAARCAVTPKTDKIMIIKASAEQNKTD